MKKELVGVIDFDLISTKKLCYYNLGVLLVSSYYLAQGKKIRLIVNLDYENLCKYSKIYVFKDYKTKIYPINLIDNYYSLPIEEYGEGFPNKDLFPNLPDLVYVSLKTDIYKPIIYYIKNGGQAFQLDKSWHDNFKPTKIFFEKDEELLLREEPKGRRLLIYDEPVLFFTTELGKRKMTEMLKSSIIEFVKPIHIGIIEPKYWDDLFYTKKFIRFKKRLYANDDDPYLSEFVEWCKDNDVGEIKLTVKTTNGIQQFKKRGGKIYGNYGLKNNDEGETNELASKENISIRHEWYATKRYYESDRSGRDRASETRRRQYLPSEYKKRWRERRRKYDAIKRGR